jgi:NitT/TauT family transport system substrate-binding protein
VSASEAEGCAFEPRRAQIFSLLAMTAMLLGSLHAGMAGAQPALTALEVEATPNDTSGTIFYAADMGFFERAGLSVKITVLNNPGAAAAAIASGTVPIGGLSLAGAALAREKGVPLVMIAPAGLYVSSAPTAGIIVLTNSPLHKAADLNGKTLAARDLSNVSYLAASLWIDRNGGDSKSIHWIELNDPLDVAAMQAGRIDAASVSEPALDAALQGGQARSMAPVFDAIAKRFLIGAFFTSEDYAKAHPDVVRKFAAAIAAAGRWANKNRDQSGQILAKYANTPVAPGSTRVTYAETLSASDVQPFLDALLNFGVLKTPLRAKDLFSDLVPSR